MLSSKQRAKLRGQASEIETIFHVGKNGVTENVIKQIDEALTAREMIKIRVLENSGSTPKDIAQEIISVMESNNIKGELITVIGTKVVLYRRNDKEPKFEI